MTGWDGRELTRTKEQETTMKRRNHGFRNSMTRGVFAVWVVAAGLLLLPPAGTAEAGCNGNGQISGILTETIENPPAHAAPLGPLAAGVIANGSRLAQATERGTLFGGCGSLEVLAGEIIAHARSKVAVVATGVLPDGTAFVDFGLGSISGAFTVNTALGRVPGKLNGVLDFGLTNHDVTQCNGQPCPFVGAAGTWSTGGRSSQTGTFVGVALVPFPCGAGPTGFCYFDPTGTLPGGPVVLLNPVTDLDHFGNPAAKFIITLNN